MRILLGSKFSLRKFFFFSFSVLTNSKGEKNLPEAPIYRQPNAIGREEITYAVFNFHFNNHMG